MAVRLSMHINQEASTRYPDWSTAGGSVGNSAQTYVDIRSCIGFKKKKQALPTTDEQS